ncbi:MAG: RAD55 family ATPase [Candidatus Thorarchaeota archaeon]
MKALDRLLDGGIPSGSVCTVIGDCGTGKSTFGIQFLAVGAGGAPPEKGLYLCAEQGEAALLADFEHLGLKKFIEEGTIKVLDVAKTRLEYGSAKASPSRSVLDSLQNEFSQTLLQLFQEVEEGGAQRIVIDHLQSFLTLVAGQMPLQEDSKRLELRNTIFWIVELCRQSGATALFIAEEGSTASEEYIVDGVLHLAKKNRNGRKIREITCQKMRRTRIGQETFLMTMEGGRLDCFSPYDSFRRPALLRPPDNEPYPDAVEGDPDSGARYISSGIPGFDDKLLEGRGFRYGSWNIFEFAYGLDVWTILLSLTTNHLNLGRGMVVILPEGYSASRFLALQEPHVLDKWEASFEERIIFFQKAPGDNNHIRHLNEDSETALKDIHTARAEILDMVGPPVLTIMSLDTLEAQYGHVGLSSLISQEVGLVAPEEKDVIIGIKREGQELARGSATPTTHWIGSLINGTLTIHGVIPQTQLYAIDLDYARGYILPELVPIV